MNPLPEGMTQEVLEDELRDLMSPCNMCKHALVDGTRKPCDDCDRKEVGSESYFISYDWKNMCIPGSQLEILEMRIEHLEAMVLDLQTKVVKLEDLIRCC